MDVAQVRGKKEPDSGFPASCLQIHEGFAWLKTRLSPRRRFRLLDRPNHPPLCAPGIGRRGSYPPSLRRSVAAEFPHAHDVLFAFYDLKVAPVLYFLWFLAAADLQRRRSGLNRSML